MDKELKDIKKHYGEKMMKYCRDNLSTIFDDNQCFNLLSKYFDYSKSLYIDLEESDKLDNFKTFIYNKYDEIKDCQTIKNKTIENKNSIEELFATKNYDFHICTTSEDVKKFKKYYQNNETLCTFDDIPGRLKNFDIYFAVKRNIEQIKRAQNPKKQDEYGTSCICIQVHKQDNRISIKNRYNHTVRNCDATFSNNLDNIVEGLRDEFNKRFNYNTKTSYDDYLEDIPNYILFKNKYYKYNVEMHNILFGINNYIIDLNANKKINYDKNNIILFNCYLLDLKNKKIVNKSLNKRNKQCGFTRRHKNIKDIKITKEGNNKIIKIDNSIITLNSENDIISYKNNKARKINNHFLDNTEKIQEINLPNVTTIGKNFIAFNKNIKKIDLPNVTTIDTGFLSYNRMLEKINLPKVITIGEAFLFFNRILKEINLPKVTTIGANFLNCNENLKKINIPKVETIGTNFMKYNNELKEINLPKVKFIESCFLMHNHNLKTIYCPKLEEVESNFLSRNRELKEINLPEIKKIKSFFLTDNEKIQKIDFPKVETIGNYFINSNQIIQKINLPNVEEIGNSFMSSNKKIKEINLPNVKKLGDGFLYENKKLQKIKLPNVNYIDLRHNKL